MESKESIMKGGYQPLYKVLLTRGLVMLSMFLLLGAQPLLGQNEDAANEIPANSSIREEIQRYLGYEPLLPRYLNLSYDSTMNINESGYFIEIGFHFLLFLPLLLLLGFTRKPIPFFGVLLSLFLLFSLSIPHSFIKGSQSEKFPATTESVNRYLSETTFSDAPTGYITALVYKGILPIATPINKGFTSISGAKDWVTYPILIALFFGLFFLLNHRLEDQKESVKMGVLLLLTYGFLWYILASGILWYGYLLLPMGILLITYGAWQQKSKPGIANQVFYYAFLGLSLFWIVTALMVRLGNIYSLDDQAGKNILDPIMVKHQMGEIDETKVFDTYFPGLPKALERINAEDQSLVYRVGTVLPFFIARNNERVFSDNQMGLFYNLSRKFPNQQTLAAVLRNYGFKYLLIDLNSASIDNTPEKTLTQKFNALQAFLRNNPKLELLATDRIVQLGSADQPVYKFRVFEGSIRRPGSFAVYQVKE